MNYQNLSFERVVNGVRGIETLLFRAILPKNNMNNQMSTMKDT